MRTDDPPRPGVRISTTTAHWSGYTKLRGRTRAVEAGLVAAE
jgi:hypothetical protein